MAMCTHGKDSRTLNVLNLSTSHHNIISLVLKYIKNSSILHLSFIVAPLLCRIHSFPFHFTRQQTKHSNENVVNLEVTFNIYVSLSGRLQFI
jgi:hypothetical protein